MRIKLYVVDLEIPGRVKRWGLGLGIPVTVLLAGGAIAYAAGLVTWTDGQTLKSADLNANFTLLQGEIAAIQQQSANVPSGTIQAYGGTVDGNPGDQLSDGGAAVNLPPTGWLLCNGDQFNGFSSTYAALYAAIGTNFGGNSGSQAFNLPDLRGRFVRGLDNGAGVDPQGSSRLVGSVQVGATALPSAGFTTNTAGGHTHGLRSFSGGALDEGNQYAASWLNYNDTSTFQTQEAGDHFHTVLGGDAETRPVNLALNFIIKL